MSASEIVHLTSVVINRSDAIGDTVLTLPMAQRLKQVFPQVRITFLTSPRASDLFLHHPYIDEILVLDPKENFWKRFLKVRRLLQTSKAEAFIHVGGSILPVWAAWLARVRYRAGLKSRWPTFIGLNLGMRQSRSLLPISEADHNLELLRPLLGEHSPFEGQPGPELTLRPEEREAAKARFCEWLISEGHDPTLEWIFIHPGMTGHTLNWPSRNYARLILRLLKKYPKRFLFIISHTPSDERYLGPLREHLEQTRQVGVKEGVVFYNGASEGLRTTMNLISFAKLFVGPSTGTTHLANCLGVPTIGIYSPIRAQSAVRWGPFYRESARVVVPDVVCGELTRCSFERCPYYECMSKIEVDDLLAECETLLSK